MAIKLGNNSSMQPVSQPQVNQPAPPQAVNNEKAPTPIATPAFREIGRKKEMVNHPLHYGGKENPYEVIKVIRAWDLSFSLGNTVKYIARAGKKDPAKKIEDLHKAMWYLQEEINNEYERSAK